MLWYLNFEFPGCQSIFNLTKISKNFPTSLGSEMNCESEHK